VDVEETLQQQPVGMAPGELAGGMNRPTRPPSGALECEEELGAWGLGAAQSVYAARRGPGRRPSEAEELLPSGHEFMREGVR
jgi:hypothetical protein